jgi:hypothetical protein
MRSIRDCSRRPPRRPPRSTPPADPEAAAAIAGAAGFTVELSDGNLDVIV